MAFCWRDPVVVNVRGDSHRLEGSPCQDSYFVQVTENSEWSVAVVCDGAGSAKNGLEGSRLTSQIFGNSLLRLVEDLNDRSPGHWINDVIIQCALDVRSALRERAGSDDLRDFHTTIVASLLGPTGGFLIHIGDGAAFGARVRDVDALRFVDDRYVVSKPENGQYANETFFITEGDWIKHLRITPLPALDWLILASDGGCSIALDAENKVRKEFIVPCFKGILDPTKLGEDTLMELLEAPESRALTNDDITIVALLSNRVDFEETKTFSLSVADSFSSASQIVDAPLTVGMAAEPDEFEGKKRFGWAPSIVGRILRRRSNGARTQ